MRRLGFLGVGSFFGITCVTLNRLIKNQLILMKSEINIICSSDGYLFRFRESDHTHSYHRPSTSTRSPLENLLLI